MTDLAKLIAADGPVRLMPDRITAEELRRLDAFWDGEGADQAGHDLTGVSDAQLHDALAADGLDPAMPDALRRDMRRGGLAMPPVALFAGLAACAFGAAVLGLASWQPDAPDAPDPAVEIAAPRVDPYVLSRPDRPAADTRSEVDPPERGGVHIVAQGRSVGEGDLTRAEIHEMQHHLDRLGYGPLSKDGLPSAALDAALSRFRSDKGLDPAEGRQREALVMLRLAARVEELRAPPISTDR